MLLTLLFICFDNLVPGACAALQPAEQALICCSGQAISYFLGSEIGNRVMLPNVGWHVPHFSGGSCLNGLQAFPPVSRQVFPDPLQFQNEADQFNPEATVPRESDPAYTCSRRLPESET